MKLFIFKGLRHLAGKNPQIVETAIRDKVHGYTAEQISNEVLKRLALSVTRGQYDVDHFVEHRTSRVLGNAGLGERILQNVCAACRGFDGKAINFKTEDNPEFIGAVSIAKPREALLLLTTRKRGSHVC